MGNVRKIVSSLSASLSDATMVIQSVLPAKGIAEDAILRFNEDYKQIASELRPRSNIWISIPSFLSTGRATTPSIRPTEFTSLTSDCETWVNALLDCPAINKAGRSRHEGASVPMMKTDYCGEWDPESGSQCMQNILLRMFKLRLFTECVSRS